MDGLIWGGLLGLLALGLFGWAAQLAARDRAIRGRLQPVQARVTNQGISPNVSLFVSSDADGNRTERRDVEYVGVYQYEVAGLRHEGRVTSPAPVFDAAQMPPARITVYYDPANPAVSRIDRAADPMVRVWRIFAGVVAAVGAAIAAVADLDWLLAALAG